MKYVEFEKLLGKTIISTEGLSTYSERVEIKCADDSEFVMYHSQEYCEVVYIEDIIGDVKDIIGAQILLAEEVVSDSAPAGVVREYQPESETWTFYKLATIKGSITIRWFGSSNGYYSESVSFEQVNP